MDFDENQEFQRKKKQSFQDYLQKKEYGRYAFDTNAQNTSNKLVADTRWEQNKIEQTATDINPRMIVSWTKPDKLFK